MIEFTSDPFCVTCEWEQNSVLLCGTNLPHCEKHQREIDEMVQTEWYKELVREMEGPHED